jgi:hypothetical protein
MAARPKSLQQQTCYVAAQRYSDTTVRRKEHPKNRSNVILNQERKRCPEECATRGCPCCRSPMLQRL